MNKEKVFVSFKKNQDEYVPFISLQGLLSENKDTEVSLKQVSKDYANLVNSLDIILNEIDSLKKAHLLIPASKIWIFGNEIFHFIDKLSAYNFQIDDIYLHLCRDLGVKRKWLEKVIIFRRYITHVNNIPENLNWGKCEKGTRRIAEQIQRQALDS